MRTHVSRGIAQRDIEQPALAVASDHQQVCHNFGCDLDDDVPRTAEAKDLRDGQPLANQGRDILIHPLRHEAIGLLDLLLSELCGHIAWETRGRNSRGLMLIDTEDVQLLRLTGEDRRYVSSGERVITLPLPPLKCDSQQNVVVHGALLWGSVS